MKKFNVNRCFIEYYVCCSFENGMNSFLYVFYIMLVNRCGSSGDHNEILKYYSLISGVVFNDVYAASKFAMEGFCECLAVQLLKFNVT